MVKGAGPLAAEEDEQKRRKDCTAHRLDCKRAFG
jgi:hypothetical protein